MGPLRSLAPLASSAAFSWPVLLLYCPLGVLLQAPGNASIYGGSVLLWSVASAVGMAALAAAFGAARVRTRGRDPRGALAVLGIYAVSGTLQSVTFGLASVLVGVAESPHLAFRLSGLFLHLPLLTAVGYAVARHDAHRRIRSELEGKRERLLSIGQSIDDELERVESELTGAVRASLEPAVASLDAAIAASGAGEGAGSVIATIDGLVEDRVRPLAHGLVADGGSGQDPFGGIEEGDSGSKARVPIPSIFPVAAAVKPGLVGLVALVGGLATAARELDPGEVLVYLPAVSLITWGLFALARRIAGTVELRSGLGVAVVVAFYSVAGSAAFWITGAIGVARPAGIAVSWAVGFALLGAASVADVLVESRRSQSEAELEEETERLESAVSSVRRREFLVRRRLAFVVHGALQGALHSAALRIAESESLTDEIGQEIRRDLSTALSQIDGRPEPGGATRTSVAVGELAAVWGGHREFSARLDRSVDERLASDADADEAVAEVVREAVNNSFRHGDAKSVQVEVGIDAAGSEGHSAGRPSEAVVAVNDDGTGPSGERGPGLGSAMFDDLCREWVLDSDQRGTVFRARIALDPAGRPQVG